jgi:cytochrome P450
MRFNPQNPFLYRLCEETYTLARGTDRETAIPAETLVFAATASAMRDPSYVPSPDEFRPGRPAESYLFFGHALHTCFGEFIATVEFRELAKPLLQLGKLQRVEGEAGQICYDGPYPSALWVEVGEAPPGTSLVT